MEEGREENACPRWPPLMLIDCFGWGVGSSLSFSVGSLFVILLSSSVVDYYWPGLLHFVP